MATYVAATHVAEFDVGNRGVNYRHANAAHPEVRCFEMLETLRLVDAQSGQRIAECGTGNGYLTFPLADGVGPSGIVTTLDDAQSNLDRVAASAQCRSGVIEPLLLGGDYFSTGRLPIESESLDAICSLATFHHYDDMKRPAFEEFARCLKPGGRVVIGDVAKGTAVARYFDEFVDRVCSTGHKHEFLDRAATNDLCEGLPLRIRSWDVRSVPWIFVDEDQLATFMHTIHDAQCTPSESRDGVLAYLPVTHVANRVALGWELLFTTIERI